MCNCVAIGCEDCGYQVPVHIADFCCPEEEVQTRCGKHPPPEGDAGWVAFDIVDDWGESGEGGRSTRTQTLYLRYTGPGMPEGYGVGEAGGITPNTACHWERGVPVPVYA